MNFRFKHIAGMAFFVGLLAGGVILAPFAFDAVRAPPPEHPAEGNSRQANASRFQVEAYLVDLGEDPLAWDCRPGQPDRVRLIRRFCFAEHILEFERIEAGVGGALQLTTRGDAVFLGEDGTKLLGHQQLSASQSDSLVAMLSSRLPRIPRYVDSWTTPPYQSAIETCISGKANLVARNSLDQQFEKMAGAVSSVAGVKLSRSSPGMCM